MVMKHVEVVSSLAGYPQMPIGAMDKNYLQQTKGWLLCQRLVFYHFHSTTTKSARATYQNSNCICIWYVKDSSHCPLLVGFKCTTFWCSWYTDLHWHANCWGAIWEANDHLLKQGSNPYAQAPLSYVFDHVPICSRLTATSRGAPGMKCERLRVRSMVYLLEMMGRETSDRCTSPPGKTCTQTHQP